MPIARDGYSQVCLSNKEKRKWYLIRIVEQALKGEYIPIIGKEHSHELAARELLRSKIGEWKFKLKGLCWYASIVLGFLSAFPRFCVEGLPKILDFDYFVLIWWQSDKKTRNPEA